MTRLEDSILVLLDVTSSGEIATSAAGLLGAAAAIGQPTAVLVTEPGKGAALAEAAAALGATRTLVAETADASTSLTVPTVDALESAARLLGPEVVLVSHSVEGREAAARFAARTSSALALNAVGLLRDEEGVVVRHSAFGGAYGTESAATFGPLVVTMRQGTIEAHAEARPVVSETLRVTPSGKPAARIASIEERVGTSSRPELRDAAKVVAFGAALGSPDGLPLIEELAEKLDAALGASRAAVEEGFAPQSWQVGQTGASVSPQLYLAVGISGAIQHRVGMQTAETIVAINTDPEAPIFGIADFGVVGDQFTIVPQLIEAIEARKA